MEYGNNKIHISCKALFTFIIGNKFIFSPYLHCSLCCRDCNWKLKWKLTEKISSVDRTHHKNRWNVIKQTDSIFTRQKQNEII